MHVILGKVDLRFWGKDRYNYDYTAVALSQAVISNWIDAYFDTYYLFSYYYWIIIIWH